MSSRPLKHLADRTLLHDLSAIISEDRATTPSTPRSRTDGCT